MGGDEYHGGASRGMLIAGRYVLEELIGRGGMADVYRARDRRLDRTVAVKIFRPGGDPEGASRLVIEARLLAPLDHPGVVTVSDGGVDESRPFLVMPLLPGGTLADRLAAGPLSVAEVARLGRELASTLAYLHGRGIVHRDVKPSNVLLDPDGRALLGDFGVSRLVGSTQATSTGQIVGTAAYLAPEQVRGGECGPAADVYALGLVLLECIDGRRVYEGANQIGVATARLHREPEVPDELPAGLRDVLGAMVATDAERRPDAAACAERLTAVAHGVPDDATTVVLPASVLAGSGVHVRTPPPGTIRGLAAAAARRSRRPAIAVAAVASMAVVGLAGAVLAGLLPFSFGAAHPPAEHIVGSGGPTASARPTSPSPTVSPTHRHSATTSTNRASTRSTRSALSGQGKRPPTTPTRGPRHRHGHDRPVGGLRHDGGHRHGGAHGHGGGHGHYGGHGHHGGHGHGGGHGGRSTGH